jgi:folate-dependent phosphoribosylglycinamide formyltransferase PurN
MYKKLYTPKDRKPRIALFMSGSGTNVEQVLEQEFMMSEKCPYETIFIFTDDKRSKAAIIGESYHKLVLLLDIRDYQKSKGLGRKLTLETETHKQVREEYSEEIREILIAHSIDFCVFGGFKPLINITEDSPCLNVHPGDLTYLKDGKRYLVGLHTVPIEKALEENIGYVRSSVIQAMPYTDSGEDMDNGPILGLGPKLFYENETDPKKIQNALKMVSDWKILPAIVLATALGKMEVDYELNMPKNPIAIDLEYKINEVE